MAIERAVRPLIQRRSAAVGAVAGAILLAGLLGGCGVVSAIHKAASTVESNKTTVDDFTSKLSSAPTSFVVTYTTTGSQPATVVYAVSPPHSVAFTVTPAQGSGTAPVDLVVNSKGTYSCTLPPPSGTGPTCTRYGKLDASGMSDLVDLYTPSHWVSFLKGVSLVAGLAGDKVTSSSMSVNGFAMKCVNLNASGVGTTTLCTTPQNLLGYVKSPSDSTTFQITKYSGTPSPTLFQIPSGAKVTTVTTSSASTTSTTVTSPTTTGTGTH